MLCCQLQAGVEAGWRAFTGARRTQSGVLEYLTGRVTLSQALGRTSRIVGCLHTRCVPIWILTPSRGWWERFRRVRLVSLLAQHGGGAATVLLPRVFRRRRPPVGARPVTYPVSHLRFPTPRACTSLPALPFSPHCFPCALTTLLDRTSFLRPTAIPSPARGRCLFLEGGSVVGASVLRRPWRLSPLRGVPALPPLPSVGPSCLALGLSAGSQALL